MSQEKYLKPGARPTSREESLIIGLKYIHISVLIPGKTLWMQLNFGTGTKCLKNLK